jgi:hypothetical protein
MCMNIEEIPKPCDADADPVLTRGRLPSDRARAKRALFESAGVLVTACWREESWRNTGSPTLQLTGGPRGQGRVAWDGGEARSTEEAG